MAREWRGKPISNMKARELIEFLLHFNLDTDVVFVGEKGRVFNITDRSNDLYLGNGEYNKEPDEIQLQSSGFKRWLKEEKNTNTYSVYKNTDFNQGEYVKIINGDDTGKVGTVLGVPVCDGGTLFFEPSGVVGLMVDNSALTVDACYLTKITKEEYEEIKNNKNGR